MNVPRRSNTDCPTGYEHRKPDGTWACEKADVDKAGQNMQVRLYDVNNKLVRGLEDSRLKVLWQRLNQWYGQARSGGTKLLKIVNAANVTAKEMLRRGMKPSGDKALMRSLRMVKAIFVVEKMNELEKARGKYLVGPDGSIFNKTYLTPMELTEDQYMVVGIDTLEEARDFQYYFKCPFIALGKAAHIALATEEHFYLPHPSAIRRFGDSGEVSRKIKSIRKSINEAVEGENQVAVISKRDDEKQIVYAVVLSPDKPDAHGDLIPVKEIENTAHGYLADSRVVGKQHRGPANGTVIESWIMHYPSNEDYQKAVNGKDHFSFKVPFGNDTITSGTWMMGVKLGDEEWNAVKAGELNAFSIGGIGQRTPVDKSTLPTITYRTLVEKSELDHETQE